MTFDSPSATIDDTSSAQGDADHGQFHVGPDTASEIVVGQRPHHRRRSAVRCVTYLVVSYLVLYPIVSTPVYADDFLNPFSQAADGGPTLADGLGFAWRGVTEGASFRVLGGPIGGAVNSLLLWFSATFDVGISTLYSLLKFTLIIACASSIAWFWSELSKVVGRRISWFGALAYVSVTLFTTLQIHAYWSNDPVGNYPLVGFGGSALGFLFLGSAIRFVRVKTATSAAVATVAALISVSYYEINVGAIVGASILLVLAVVRSWRSSDRRRTVSIGSAAIVIVPALFILAGRRVTGDQAATYGGTTVRLGGEALRTFGLGLAGSIPGAAWGLSVDTLGGVLDMVPFAIGVAALLTWIAMIRRRDALRADDPMASISDATLAGAAAVALVVYWLVAILVQAITVKVQEETIELGYVYTSYSFGAAVIALFLAIVARAAIHDSRFRGALPILGACAVSFVLVQQTINWRLSEQLNEAVQPSRQLLASFDDDATPPERCQALLNWSSGGWPEYYEVEMIEGLDVAYRYYFDEPFCDAFVRPP